MSIEQEFAPEVNVMPAADVVAKPPDVVITPRDYTVHIPKEELEDFVVEIRASQLKRIREYTLKLKGQKFPWEEILLALATTSLGAIASGWIADFQFDGFKKVIFQHLLPLIVAISGTLYFTFRHNNLVNSKAVANELLREVPDPQETSLRRCG